mmetsp:Transcript_3083/g.13354  ORF Transcript_3083/g.13354 Transcript_3083/m.13354 type:complete len:102 (-) Transcript_3083:2061-2366(-)
MTVPSNDWSASSSISLLGMSRWLVGSSRSRTSASQSIALAMASFILHPPESDWIVAAIFTSSKPTSFRVFTTVSRLTPSGTIWTMKSTMVSSFSLRISCWM